MTAPQAIAAGLSCEARYALELCTGGVRLVRWLGNEASRARVLAELESAALIGPGQGLTVRGECVAQIVQDELLDRVGL